MFDELKKTLGHAGIYTIGVLLNRAVSFVMLPIYTRYLSPADYGILELLMMTVEIVAITAGMGIHYGLYKYYYHYDSEKDKKELVSTIIILALGFYLVASVIGSAFSWQLSYLVFGSEDYGYLILLSFINMFLQFLMFISLAYVQTIQKSVLFVLTVTVKLILQLSLNILFVVYLGMGIEGILYSSIIAATFLGLVLTGYTFSQTRIRFSREKAALLIRFGVPFIFTGYGAFILTFSDRYFLNHYWDTTEVGIYSLGYKFGFLLAMIPVKPIMNIWNVKRFELAGQEGFETVVNQMLFWFFVITLSAALFISLFIKDLLVVMSDPAFWEAHKVVPVLLFAYFLQACTDFFNFGIHHTGKTKHMAWASLLSAVAIIIMSFALIPGYGIYGAAWATLVAFAIRLVYVYFVSQRLFRVGYSLARPVTVLVLATAVYVGYDLIVKFFGGALTLYTSVVLAAVSFLTFLILLFVLSIINDDEKRVIFDALRSPLKAFGQVNH